jgi:hypothetical protein
MSEKTDEERIKEMQVLAEALEAERTRSRAYWNAATAETGTAWVAGRDAERRMIPGTRNPERRRRSDP